MERHLSTPPVLLQNTLGPAESIRSLRQVHRACARRLSRFSKVRRLQPPSCSGVSPTPSPPRFP